MVQLSTNKKAFEWKWAAAVSAAGHSEGSTTSCFWRLSCPKGDATSRGFVAEGRLGPDFMTFTWSSPRHSLVTQQALHSTTLQLVTEGPKTRQVPHWLQMPLALPSAGHVLPRRVCKAWDQLCSARYRRSCSNSRSFAMNRSRLASKHQMPQEGNARA